MKKEFYSLVLSKIVIAAIDREASAKGTSRSNLINSILAQHVHYETPEQRMQDIFSYLENMLCGDIFYPIAQPSDSIFSMRTSLDFKYNPNVRYSVELYRDAFPVLGKIKVSLRTQNHALIDGLDEFFTFWNTMERGAGLPRANITNGRYERLLAVKGAEGASLTNQEVSIIISDYIRALDGALKAYFYADDVNGTIDKICKSFDSYVASSSIIV